MTTAEQKPYPAWRRKTGGIPACRADPWQNLRSPMKVLIDLSIVRKVSVEELKDARWPAA